MRHIFLLVVMLFATSCTVSTKPRLYLFCWSEIFAPELIELFEEEFGCEVVLSTYDSNESLYAKLKLGATGYDLIFPSSYFLPMLGQQNLIQPLDPNKIPNLAELDPHYFNASEKPCWGIPFLIGCSGLAFRQDRLGDIEHSWTVFARGDLRGRMTMLNDMRDTLGAALLVNGHSINSRDPVEIEQAADRLISWKHNLAKFESEQYKSGLASAEFLVTHSHAIDIAQVRQENPNVHFVYPKEGAVLAIDYIAMPKDARNRDLAYAFVNFMLDPLVAAHNIAYVRALIPVAAAYQYLAPELKTDALLFPSDEDRNKMQLIEDLQDDIRYYYKAWDRAKATWN